MIETTRSKNGTGCPQGSLGSSLLRLREISSAEAELLLGATKRWNRLRIDCRRKRKDTWTPYEVIPPIGFSQETIC